MPRTEERIAKERDRLLKLPSDELNIIVRQLIDGTPASRDTADCEKPGPELAVGEAGRVELDELPLIERIIGPNNQLPVAFLEEGVAVQRAVAKVVVTMPNAGGWSGTGWLIGRSLLITNNHVLGSKDEARNARADFNYQNSIAGAPLTVDSWALDPDNFFYTNVALDFTIVRVKTKVMWVPPHLPSVQVPPLADGELLPTFPSFWMRAAGDSWGYLRLPAAGVSYATDQILNCIGHPSGRPKEVSLQENKVTSVHLNVVRYTTDTEPGSSGSPVLTNAWDPVALHHAAGTQQNGVWIDNEGIRLDAIVTHLRANVAASVLTELGV